MMSLIVNKYEPLKIIGGRGWVKRHLHNIFPFFSDRVGSIDTSHIIFNSRKKF